MITKAEFQKKHKLTNQEFERIELILKMFNGKIASIKDIPKKNHIQ